MEIIVDYLYNYSQENPQVFYLWEELAINKYYKNK